MIEDTIETVEQTSPDLVAEQTEQLKAIFPQVFSEGKVDFEKLRAALGDIVDTRPERYSFTWTGKRNATLLLQAPSYATLTPAENESVNFENTQNLFLEGDNLEVLKLLYKSYSGRVKMIYIDPPYNTGNDFIYPDDFTDPLDTYLRVTGQKDANGNLLTSNPETSGRYHSAWLSMMYPRLYLARQMLCDDGVVFVSIDDHEVYNLRLLMNEIFGDENFIECLIWKKKKGGGNDSTYVAVEHEYLLFYARNKKSLDKLFYNFEEGYASRYKERDEVGSFYWDTFRRKSGKQYYPIECPDGTTLEYDKNGNKISWLRSKGRFLDDLEKGEARIIQIAGKWSVQFKQRQPEGKKPRSIVSEFGTTSDGSEELLNFFKREVFENPKPSSLIRYLLSFTTDKDSLVLDFFAGSCTTAHAVLDLNREDDGNRHFIMIQFPELIDNKKYPEISEQYHNVANIGKERIRRVINKIKQEDNDKLDLPTRATPEDLGFRVFKLEPSNYKQWHSIDSTDAEAYTKQLMFFTDPLVEGWRPDSVIWEVAVKEGYGLNTSIKQLEGIKENTVWQVHDPDKAQSFLICLDDELQPATLSALPLSKEQMFVCRNKALDDTKAANLALQCRLKKI